MTLEQYNPPDLHPPNETEHGSSLMALAVRGTIAGMFMGLANIVPGISGGTMLLAVGVYPRFVSAVAEVTTFRFRLPSLVLLGSIVLTAALAIVLLAGTVKGLVVDHRWVMYSLFIGLTLGGVPIVWRLIRCATREVVAGAAVGFGLMIATLFFEPGSADEGGRNYVMLFFAGLAGASAMVLPGISGGYLLLVLGQYVPILGSIDRAKDAVAAKDLAAFAQELHVVVPLGLGVLFGVVAVSNAVRWLLSRHEKPTLGLLLGLLLGAVVGLWPFQQGVQPSPGDVVRGRVMTAELIAELEPEDYPTEFFQPNRVQVFGSCGLVLAGWSATLAIARLGFRPGGG